MINNNKPCKAPTRRAKTPEGKARQLHALKHNGMRGHIAMMRGHLDGIIRSPSTTQDTKHHAQIMLTLAYEIQELLKTRVDPP